MNRLFLAVALTLIASLLPNVLLRESLGYLPPWWPGAKILLLLLLTFLIWIAISDKKLWRYGLVLALIVVMQFFFGQAQGWWQYLYLPDSFVGQFGGAVFLKGVGVVPVVGLLLLLYKSPREVYLVAGNLSAKASAIAWLGIKAEIIGWGRLSVISGVMVAAGTLGLTLLTMVGLSQPTSLGRLLPFVPLVLLLAVVNSFSEGVVYRSAVLGPLKNAIPKAHLLWLAAGFFGVANFYGAPGGWVGVMAASLLGWYMCRSMYETGGFLAAWVIHFARDVVIFSTVVVVGGF